MASDAGTPPGAEPDDDRLHDNEVEDLKELIEKDEDELTDAEVTSKTKLSVKRRFEYGTWLLAFEFTNRHGKRADAIALNTMPSRNFPIVGFEFKASRSDWLSEKKDHEKADYFVQLCDEWYVVAGRRGIVEEEELPDGWGLLELKPSGQLWKLVESDLKDVQDVDPDRRFYTKFIKKTVGNETNYAQEDLREAEKRGYQKAVDEGVHQEADFEIQRLENKAEKWDDLQDAGFDFIYSLDESTVRRLELAYKIAGLVQTDEYSSIAFDVEQLTDRIERLQDDTEQLQTGLERLEELLCEEPLPMEGSE